MTAYDMIDTYLGPAASGPFAIPCDGRRTVVVDGKQIQYGPLTGTITLADGMKIVLLDDPGITAEIDYGMHAVVKRIECTPTATFAMCHKLGFVFRKKINLSFEDA